MMVQTERLVLEPWDLMTLFAVTNNEIKLISAVLCIH